VRVRKEDLCISIHFDEEENKWIGSATSSANYTPSAKQMTAFEISAESKASALDCLINLLKLLEIE
jgi:hypothetical protein